MSRKSLIIQAGTLKSYFPKSKIERNGEKELIWIGDVTPSPLSAKYTLELHYRYNEGAKVYVIDPKPLQLADGEKVLPHVYSTPKQQLCLYYPKDNEWNTGMLYVHSLIPWACEWLCHYELWVCTGTWHGGGIHPEAEVEKQTPDNKESIDDNQKSHIPKDLKKEI